MLFLSAMCRKGNGSVTTEAALHAFLCILYILITKNKISMEPLQLKLFEDWKPLPGNEKYLISTDGRCMIIGRIITSKAGWKRYREGRMLVPHDNGNGYFAYLIDGKHRYIHRLVAMTYIPNPENKEQVDHIDGNKSNNCVDNLRWATRSENILNPVTYFHMSEVQKKKTIVMLDADGKFVCEIEGIAVASKKLGFSESNIKACLERKMKNETCNGFLFLYKEDYNPLIDYTIISKMNKGYDFVYNERMIVVYSNNTIYDTFPSAAIAGKFFGISRETMNRLIYVHTYSNEKILRKLPIKCKIYLFKDIVGKDRDEVKRFYRAKYPIPEILKR